MLEVVRRHVEGRVLLLDDDPGVLKAYARVLRAAGFAVVEACDGHRVDEILAQGEIDVVVSDIDLPGASGIDVLRAVRRQDADLPVVLMTGSGDLKSAVAAVELGALRYLLKPVAPAALSKVAADAIRLRRISTIKRRASELYGKATNAETNRAELSASLDRALAAIHMAYQPIVRWSTRDVFAYEALLQSDEPSMRTPDVILAAAERLDRIFDVGRAIPCQVAETIASSSPSCVFVNLHPRDLEDEELLSPSSPLAQFASRVVLEVTERSSLHEIGDLRGRLETLRALGYRLAIDDLGAGYAGLTSFTQLAPEVVKLDMSLVRDVDTEPTKHKLVESMIRLSGELGIHVVCEGVETARERDALVEAGCNLLQGYFFARPGPAFPAIRRLDESDAA